MPLSSVQGHRWDLQCARYPSAAEDLFQQTWLQVVRHIDRYKAERSFDTWLFSIAHNLAIDFLRRRRHESLDDPAGEPPSGSQADVLAEMIASERAAILASELAALPPVYRETLTLRFEEEMKLEEIAEVVHAPLSTVKSRLRRGLACLRERLGKLQ